MKIADDFTPPKDTDQQDDNGRAVPGPIDDGEARLAYVAVTRTRHRLDLGGLSWIHDHPEGGAAPQTMASVDRQAAPRQEFRTDATSP